MNDLVYQIAITKIPLVGAVTAKTLISYCGGVKNVFDASLKELKAIPGVGPLIAGNIVKQQVLDKAAEEISFLEKYKIKPLFYLNDDYPHRLKHYSDCPILLYYSGNADLNHQRIVGVVGTRRPNSYGIQSCESLIMDLKEYDPLVISGLAYGIDITAHKKCIMEGIPTVAALGHGLSRIYPNQHQGIARQMINCGGLLTEYTSDHGPDREHFPMRNRIIAGLCDALVVVQTAQKGGSMISAEIANGYYKEVFAFPGRVSDPCSVGCNHLIKSHKANLIESASDIAYVMGWEKKEVGSKKSKQLQLLNAEEQSIVSLLKEQEEISIDQLTLAAQMTSSQMAAILLNLEFRGLVRTLPGKRYAMA